MKGANHFLISCTLGCLLMPATSIYAEEIVLHTIHLPPHIIDSAELPPPSDFGQVEAVYGFDVDVLRAAYATQGVTVRIELTPWKRIMRDVEEGLILGAVSCRPLPIREKFAFFSTPLSDSANAFVTRRSFLDDDVSTLAVLKKFHVSAVNGWSQTDILDSAKIPYSSVSGLDQGINLVLRRNQDIFMTERDSAIFAAQRMGVIDQLSFYDVAELGLDYYSGCFSKKYPDAEKWRDVLNKGLKELDENGKRDEIFKRYGFSSLPN
ncbi:MAG: transporter substrate-binding domain-containing protein [Gammaproteobacteria bacterium]|nr:transporter substrate-binding domain-containing protein [Gammaproteobacteria bacterium]MBU1467480.1 transporter substrate-binding domain-containing protein [Gammaproteobacteria bacterium]MBU2414343.1 transporter substrate-binding domain-containing protein [Gammaproteobacteria bacterium]|tara:strand:+ start:6525 stop:7319 length:795 start_codon:yes stop_codon:yes gene_type:complete